MQWRALILLISGLAVLYIAILSQDTPHLHPKVIYTSNHPRLFAYKPDKLIMSTSGPFIYLTAIKYEALKQRGSLVGTGQLKLGVQGYIKQIRKPISNLLTERDVLETDGWVNCFEHELKGPISKISQHQNEKSQFAVLYHQVEDDQSFHYVRVYYIHSDQFEYKDILLPGTTLVNAISLENNSIIYSRDPDEYEFHIMTLPSDLFDPPHSTLIKDLEINHGRLTQEWAQPQSTEQYSTLFSRLYSPNNETYRVFTLNVHKTTTTFYVNITIADNATVHDKEGQLITQWIQREKGESDYPVYHEDNLDYVGFSADLYQPNPRVQMPELHATLTSDGTTIVFPYIKNKFITLDYSDQIEILRQIKSERERLYQNEGRPLPEYYYWQGYETVDAEIKGVRLDDRDRLGLWTEFDQVYLYGRASHGLNRFDRLVDYLVSDVSEQEKELRDRYFPPPWQLDRVISPNKDGKAREIGMIHFWKDKAGESYIFVGFKDGNLNSYRIDQHEPHTDSTFWAFASERWDMLFAMCMVIFIFVYNEYQRT